MLPSRCKNIEEADKEYSLLLEELAIKRDKIENQRKTLSDLNNRYEKLIVCVSCERNTLKQISRGHQTGESMSGIERKYNLTYGEIKKIAKEALGP